MRSIQSLAPSTNGIGHRPFTAVIVGSNPRGVTIKFILRVGRVHGLLLQSAARRELVRELPYTTNV